MAIVGDAIMGFCFVRVSSMVIKDEEKMNQALGCFISLTSVDPNL